MLKKEAMAWMMPVRMEATPFTMAIRQLPMARNMPWICKRDGTVSHWSGGRDPRCHATYARNPGGLPSAGRVFGPGTSGVASTYTRDDGTHCGGVVGLWA